MYPKIDSETKQLPDGEMCNIKGNMQQMKKKDINCQQFFPKTTKMTKDFMDKMYVKKLAKAETYVLEDGSKCRTISVIAALVVLFLFSFFGVFFMWYTDGFNNIIYSNMVIREGAPGYEIWRKPPLKILVKVYLFNYTNVDRFEDGQDAKLNVQEKGPYVYEESMERVNLNFSGNRVSFQLKKSYKFVPELSKGRQNDIIVVPNMFLLGATAINRYSSFLTKLTVSSGLNGLYSKAFLSLAADRLIMGYDDSMYALSRSIMVFQDKKMADKIGLLSKNIGVSDDVMTVHTGQGDIDKIGKILSVNGKDKVNFWSTEECNSFTDSTDGTLFSPKAVSQKKPLKVFQKDMFRHVPLVFKKESTILDGDIPSYTYEVPDNFFDSPDYYPANQCYCEMDGGTCPPHGLFNSTLCSMGVPTFISNPHFHRADPKLTESITGLNPNGTLHGTTMELHPTMGFPMSGNTRLQINMQILKISEFSQLYKYQDGMILPIAWFDVSMQDKYLPEEIKDIIATTTHTVALIKNLLKYGSIVIAIMTLIPIAANLRYKMTKNKRRDSTRPLRKQDSEVEA
ncbi:scavenger receptor class B member 1-like [Coccinella septempunctata]|uniref:scavenger receptor class B member 1-like n=1 Tax=Coccinella septempunctata TaxID=41139 RepID=UPI001D09174A|nr:scavenger receptor class B member 1-like [Coccinella septempunctata]